MLYFREPELNYRIAFAVRFDCISVDQNYLADLATILLFECLASNDQSNRNGKEGEEKEEIRIKKANRSGIYDGNYLIREIRCKPLNLTTIFECLHNSIVKIIGAIETYIWKIEIKYYY